MPAAPELTPEEEPLAKQPVEAVKDQFLREGAKEVRASAEAVYTENVELRSRIEVFKGLTSRLAQTTGLPEDVRHSLQTVLSSALPPQASVDPAVALPPPPRDVHGNAEPARNMVQGRVFALNVRELCRSMDRYQPRATTRGRTSSDASSSGASRRQQRDGEEAELLALTENGEGLWNRTRAVCIELFSGWT